MLLILTPDTPDKTTYTYLNQWADAYDRCHLKLSCQNTQELYAHIEHLLSFDNPTLKNKLVIHINEKQSGTDIHQIQDTLHHIAEHFNIHRFHFSENLLNFLFEKKQTSIFHQYNISASIHHLNIHESYNCLCYVIYGPIFPSISKENYFPKINLSEIPLHLRRISETTEIPIIAIGGITPHNFQDALKAGFSGLAIRGYVWNNPHPEKNFQTLIDKWKNNQNLS